ncbi:MAG: hypothetical protein LUD68_02540 [Rikenellaceae bacterium]|nr:hypothetical protein [Rikenellaceae bacterium]
MLLVFWFASCQKGSEAGEPEPNPDPGTTRTVQFDLSSLNSAALASLVNENLTFLFYQDGSLLQKVVASLDEENAATIDVPFDQATQLIVVAGGTLQNTGSLETLTITTGDAYDQEVFATPVTNVQTNGTNISLTLSRMVGKVGIRPTDSDQQLEEASFDALDVVYHNLITAYRPGAEEPYVYQTVTQRVTRNEGYLSGLMSIVHPADATDEQLIRIGLDYYAGQVMVGSMAEAQPLSGISVTASVFTVLQLSLLNAFNPISRSISADPGEIILTYVEF